MKGLQVGITGGIGSGKSLVCRCLQTLGVPVYEADAAAKLLLETDPELRQAVQLAFGPQAYTPEGKPDRTFLAAQVFGNPEALARLNALVHPHVGIHYREWAAQQLLHHPYVVKEAAILFESGSHRGLDYTVAVTAPEELRLQRTLARDPQRTPEQVRQIMQRQMPEEERNARADFLLDNSGKHPLLPQILALHQRLLELGRQRQ